MIDWFLATFGEAVDQARHELVGGWFGRNFEPNPAGHHADHDLPERDHAAEFYGREHGIDR